MLQDELAVKYKYKKLPLYVSRYAINEYWMDIPVGLNIDGDSNFIVMSKCGTIVSKGYNRIVIGDYGAFIEFDSDQVVQDNIQVQKGQEYRINDASFINKVKYIWLTASDDSKIKIYFQQKTVDYADYVVGKFYVSPYEIKIN